MEGDKWYLLRRCSQPTKHFLEKCPLDIGRSVDAFIVCSCLHVSKDHATITCQNGNLIYLRDNKTTNGTYINGERMEPGRFSLLMEHDVISFGKPEEVMEDFDSEYCFQLLLEKQQPVPNNNTNEKKVLGKKLHYLENLIEHQLEELYSLAEYSQDGNIAEVLEKHQSGGNTSRPLEDIEHQLEAIHSSIAPNITQALPGSITQLGLPHQEPPPRSPVVASVQDHSDAVPHISRSTTIEPIALQAPLLSTNSNAVQVNKVKPSPKSKKPHYTRQLEPQPDVPNLPVLPNVSNINDITMIITELSRAIKLEIIEPNEPVSSTDKDSSQVEQVQAVPNPQNLSNLPQLQPQMESPVIIDNSYSIPKKSSSEYSIPENKLPESSPPSSSDTSQSIKDKESKLKKSKSAVQKESKNKNKKDNHGTIEKHLSKSKKLQTVLEKEPSVSKKRTSQSAIDDSSSKAKKLKKVENKLPEPSPPSNSDTSQSIKDKESKLKKSKSAVKEESKNNNKKDNHGTIEKHLSKSKKLQTVLEKEPSVSKKRTLQSAIDDSSSKAKKPKKEIIKIATIADNSFSKAKKSMKLPEKEPSVSNTKLTSLSSRVSLDKSSPKTQKTKKPTDQSSSKRKSVIDDTYSKANKGKKLPDIEPSISKRRTSQSVKDTNSSKAVKSNDAEPSDSKSRRTSHPGKSSTSTESKCKETKSTSIFKITDSNSNKEKRNSLPARISPEGFPLTESVKIRPRSMSMHVLHGSNRRQSILIDPLPSVTRRSSRIKAKNTSPEKTLEINISDSTKPPPRHRSKSLILNVNEPKHSKSKEKTKKNSDTSEGLKELQEKILSQLSFLPPPLQSTVERLKGSIRLRSYSLHDLALSPEEEAPPVTIPRGILKRPRSYSTLQHSVTFAPDTVGEKTSQSTTGQESSQTSKKYGRSYSTVGFASATSPTQSPQAAQPALTDIWKRRDDTRRGPSMASYLLDVLNQPTHQTADSTTDQTSVYDSLEAPSTSESTNISKPCSFSNYGRIIDPRFTHDSNARETHAMISSNRNKPISRSYTMCGTVANGKFTKEPQSRRNYLDNQLPQTPSPGGHSPGPGSSAVRGASEHFNSYLGNGKQNIKQDRGGRKSNYDGDRKMSTYVSKAPAEESLPEYHRNFLAHIIRWNPAWLAEYVLHDTLPPIFHETKTEIPVMMYTYKNFEVYSDTQICLVILEVWEAAFAAYKETKDKNDELDFTLLSNPPKAFVGTKITKVTLKINSKNILTNGSRSVCYGMLLLVKFPELPKCSSHWFLAMIDETEYKGRELLVNIYVKLDPWQIAFLGPNALVKVKLLNSIKNELAMVRAVYDLQASKLQEQIVSPRPKHFRKFTNLSPMQWKHDLNPSQLKAVSQCICALTSAIPGIQIIQGPPGTGKSRVIVSIVMEYLQRTIKCNRGKVLLCAQTNVAIDEIVLRLMEAKEKMTGTKKFSIVRVGRCESMHPRALSISSTEMAKQFDNYPDVKHQMNVLRKQIEKYSIHGDSVGPQAAYFKVQHQLYSKKLDDLVSFHSSPNTLYHEEMAIIEKADVIATTLQGCSLKKMQGLKNKITFCIVDEAAKATEPEILIPLSLGVNNIFMVGDRQQLAAFVMSQHARKHGLSESLFSRLIHCSEFSESSCTLPLNTQYRMHPDIVHFPNLAFYEGNLQNGQSDSPTSGVSPPSGMPPLCGLPPYRVVEMRGRSEDQDESGANVDEAKVVARLALAIDTHVRENELNLSICVLTPYAAQREAIQHKLRNLTTRRIEVSTVDSFQGQERDVVVVSCARSFGIGFLDDPGRMSVLLTRAKKSCIVCCNPEALREHSLWAALISDAENRLMRRPLPLTLAPYVNEEDNCKIFMTYLQ